jgi:hypothetical protein
MVLCLEWVFGGKELAWTSEMRPHAGVGKFGGAVEGE